jgi:hypothetical protein
MSFMDKKYPNQRIFVVNVEGYESIAGGFRDALQRCSKELNRAETRAWSQLAV